MEDNNIKKVITDLNFDLSEDPNEPKLSEEETTQAGDDALERFLDMVMIPKDLETDEPKD